MHPTRSSACPLPPGLTKQVCAASPRVKRRSSCPVQPTSRSEARPQDLADWIRPRAGRRRIPVPADAGGDASIPVAECNIYIFPESAAVTAVRATRITDADDQAAAAAG
jgi:hypothetical protein